MEIQLFAKQRVVGASALAASVCALCSPLAAVAQATPLCTTSFIRTLSVGATGADVLQLQKLLNTSPDTQVAQSGDGSPGHETSRFGALTKAAVIRFQEKHADDILVPAGLAAGTGIVGPSTRAKLYTLCAMAFSGPSAPLSATTSAGSTPQVRPGSVLGEATSTPALVLTPAEQPVASLAPSWALSIPFTHLTLTAEAEDVTVRSVTIERVGPGQDQAFDSVDLMDTDGGYYDTGYLDSNHRTVIRKEIVIPAGSSLTLVVAASIADAAGYEGQLAGFSIVAIDASAPIRGELPVRGTYHTINSSLTLGVPHVSLAPEDPATARTRYINDTNITFSAIRITPDSAEAQKLSSISWRQAGSAAASDISDMHMIVNGTRYEIEVDGRDYYAEFGDGIVMHKGRPLDIVLRGSLTTTGSNRTVQFDIHDGGDIGIEGLTYGFGIFPVPEANTDTLASNNHSIFATSDGTTDGDSMKPFFVGSTVTISPGAMVHIGR